MKIRNGFVSNSSSSSFMIYGGLIEVDDDTMAKLATKFVDDDDYFNEDPYGALEGVFKSPYTVERLGYESDIVIGIDPSNMDINKTLKETMDEIKAHITKTLGEDVDISFGWYEDCSYDG